MSIGYGQRGYILTPANITQIDLVSCTFDSVAGGDKFHEWSFTAANVGCGSTGATMIINDATIPFPWTKIAWRTRVNFTSACWNFANTNSSYGIGAHNILSWNTALGDAVSRTVNSFELSQYALKMEACDNETNNFLHPSYATGSFREWNMFRRRNGTNTAAAAAGFACTSGGVFKISQLMVFR